MGQKQYSTARLRWAIAQLEEVEEEIRGMESLWGGSPLLVNPAQYEHDWVQFANAARARSHYAHLLERRRELRERIRRMGGGA